MYRRSGGRPRDHRFLQDVVVRKVVDARLEHVDGVQGQVAEDPPAHRREIGSVCPTAGRNETPASAGFDEKRACRHKQPVDVRLTMHGVGVRQGARVMGAEFEVWRVRDDDVGDRLLLDGFMGQQEILATD